MVARHCVSFSAEEVHLALPVKMLGPVIWERGVVCFGGYPEQWLVLGVQGVHAEVERHAEHLLGGCLVVVAVRPCERSNGDIHGRRQTKGDADEFLCIARPRTKVRTLVMPTPDRGGTRNEGRATQRGKKETAADTILWYEAVYT
jgi:hypothetical protein